MSQAKITTSLSRRSVLAGVSVAVAPMAAGAGLSGDDAELRLLWAEYLVARAAETSEESNERKVRARFDDLMPPCPHDVILGDHWAGEAVQLLWKSTGAAAAYHRWNAAVDTMLDVIERIQRTPAEGLFGVGVKLAALNSSPDQCDYEDGAASALACINRLTGSNFPIGVADDEDDELP
jgi:hypothetical protein